MTFTELEMVLLLATAVLTTLYFNLRTEHLQFRMKTVMLLRAIAERKAIVSIKDDEISIEPTRS